MLILSGTKSKSSASHLAGFATYLGATVRLLDCPRPVQLLADPEDPSAALCLCAETLSELYRDENCRVALRRKILASRNLLIYGVRAGVHEEVLDWLSGGALPIVAHVTGAEYGEFPELGKPFSRQLCGTQYPRSKNILSCDVFDTVPTSAVPLISVSAKPTFLYLRIGTCNLFASTVTDIPDPQQPVMNESEMEPHLDAILPLLLFVRAACGDSCWQGGYKGARLIIDDPLLRRRYGLLDFSRLFESMQNHHYSATVAFIPWNQPRTSKNMADFFAQTGQRFSICVHGCDHANNEYGSLDADLLERKSQLAMQRMRHHAQRTGIGFEPIMVFPQGRFSTACFRGLQSNDFIAAINSTRFPVDRATPPVSLCELLLPTFNSVYGFPVFLRHYPKSNFPFLLDLFLGRPAFIVEHHDFFRQGFPALEALAGRLRLAEPDLLWPSLSEIVERTCWQRALAPGVLEVRFFTDLFSITNSSSRPASYRLLKEEPELHSDVTVTLNGSAVPLNRNESRIEIVTTLVPGATARVQLHRQHKASSSVPVRRGIVYEGKVLLRRALSEFRDEVLVKHPAMLVPAKRIVRMLKATPDPAPQKPVSRNADPRI